MRWLWLVVWFWDRWAVCLSPGGLDGQRALQYRCASGSVTLRCVALDRLVPRKFTSALRGLKPLDLPGSSVLSGVKLLIDA